MSITGIFKLSSTWTWGFSVNLKFMEAIIVVFWVSWVLIVMLQPEVQILYLHYLIAALKWNIFWRPSAWKLIFQKRAQILLIGVFLQIVACKIIKSVSLRGRTTAHLQIGRAWQILAEQKISLTELTTDFLQNKQQFAHCALALTLCVFCRGNWRATFFLGEHFEISLLNMRRASSLSTYYENQVWLKATKISPFQQCDCTRRVAREWLNVRNHFGELVCLDT